MKRAALALVALLALAGPARAQAPAGPRVERVELNGNQFLQKETLLYYVHLRPGDPYDEFAVREDFQRLWATGFLDDMRVDALDGAAGKIVVFTVRERKRIQIVDYRGSKALTTTSIEDKLKEKEAVLRLDTFYEPSKARRVEGIIREMLAEKGRPFGTVKHDAKNIGGAGMQVSFIIDDGPKAKVKKIEFEGNEVFSDGNLRRRMKKIKQAGFWNLSWLGGKSTYTEEKWADPAEGDRKRLHDHYLNHGHVTASVGEPRITYADGKSGLFKKKPVKWMTLTIPVTEGDQYRLGELSFEGLTVFKEDALRPLFKLKTGDVYRESRFKKAYDKLRDAYGGQGYFQWTVGTRRRPDPDRKVVDVTVDMEEDKRYYVARIRFTGNDTTRDKVIRREIYMNEGDVFNTEALKVSIRRINQLGYFKPMERPPQISPSPLGEDKLDLTFKVEEQNRNQFTFGGGVSGLEGTFINASFSTSNFLGLGETFQVYAQSGARTKNYQLAVTEPYLFDRPITLGIDVFSRKLRYDPFLSFVGYTEEATGASLVTGLPVGRFTRLFANYSYQVIDVAYLQLEEDGTTSEQPALDPFLFGEEGRRKESALSPQLIHNTVDNPWTPRAGMKVTASAQLTGGPLGGTVDFVRPTLETVLYLPHTRRTALGLRGEAGFIIPFGETTTLPYYRRFFLGGETQIRGYDIRRVGPLDAEQNRLLGGNKYALFNAEYYFDVGGPLRLLLFFDAGQAFSEGERIQIGKFKTSTGVELRFIMPVLNVPFRLIYAINPNHDEFTQKSTFKFAVGTTF
jgi:outer membrane protein insertion porin family